MPATISGTYKRSNNQPAAGFVRFALTELHLDHSGAVRTCAPVTAALDHFGAFTVDLVAGDELADGTAAYTVTEEVSECFHTWTLQVPDTTPVDLPAARP